jgi:DNA-binding transcriptional ArsR family regulator
MSKSSVANTLFSGTRHKLLSALLLRPRQRVYAAELAKQLRVRPSTLQRDLARLTQAGILIMTRDGNRTYFQANAECPIFPELRALMLKTSGPIEALPSAHLPPRSKTKPAPLRASTAKAPDLSGSASDSLTIGSDD